MNKILFAVAALSLEISSAFAQANSDPRSAPTRQLSPEELPQNGGAGIRSGNIAPTGRTMPNVGVSQGGGVTDMDRGIQAEDNRISNSICKGC